MSAGPQRSAEHQQQVKPPESRCTCGSCIYTAQGAILGRPTGLIRPCLSFKKNTMWVCWQDYLESDWDWGVSLHLHRPSLQRCLWWLMLTTITVMVHSLPESVTIRFQCILTAVIQPSVLTFSFCVKKVNLYCRFVSVVCSWQVSRRLDALRWQQD